MDSVDALRRTLDEHELEAVAVVLTHGHIDHVAGAQVFADPLGLPVHCHPADHHLLSDPVAGLGPESRALLRQMGWEKLTPPATLVELTDGGRLDLAGFEFDLLHAPGHTGGCTLVRVRETPHGPVVLSGDVVFAGSIGRTDLPGGDAEVMRRSLREVVLGLDDATHLLPGHGPATSMAAERATNPYLQDAFLLDA